MCHLNNFPQLQSKCGTLMLVPVPVYSHLHRCERKCVIRFPSICHHNSFFLLSIILYVATKENTSNNTERKNSWIRLRRKESITAPPSQRHHSHCDRSAIQRHLCSAATATAIAAPPLPSQLQHHYHSSATITAIMSVRDEDGDVGQRLIK